MALMSADSEAEVIQVLTDAGFWGEEAAWRDFGDDEGNWAIIGAQQSSPEAAMVEKIVNSIDARLMGACMEAGVAPEGPQAPQTIREAVATFFDDVEGVGTSGTSGLVREWNATKRTEVARGITLAATGFKPRDGDPCFTISDNGEGQTPSSMPRTLLSLRRTNKLRIPFVQGKFNMGGTGVFRFCGKHHFQLILSRRNPALLSADDGSNGDGDWCFTLVRRDNPRGNVKNSVFRYLAPVGAGQDPGKGGLLTFKADSMPIFPVGNKAYSRPSGWGTLIKVYEYGISARTHMFRRDGLQERLDLLLPEPALPIRLHECRDYGGFEDRSFETTLTGLAVRLDDDRSSNLETGFPDSGLITAVGEQMRVTIYAFKPGRAKTYRKNEGIMFTQNGQTHGVISSDFFRRKDAGRLGYIKDSILVHVDCSGFSGETREDLFMNSRDRLSKGMLRREIEGRLENLIKDHAALRELNQRRRREETEKRLQDEKPLEDVLNEVFKRSPTLARIFLAGQRATSPFKTKMVSQDPEPYQGKTHPSYFKIKGVEYGKPYSRNCHINMRARIAFETDAENDYFRRLVNPGEFDLVLVSEGEEVPLASYALNLRDGVANLTVSLPEESVVGDTINMVARVSDPTLLTPFENRFELKVLKPAEQTSGTKTRRKPPSEKKGKDREMPAGIQLPDIKEVTQKQWGDRTPPFDQYTGMQLIITSDDQSSETEEADDVFDLYLNMDNSFLLNELKEGRGVPELTKAKWKYAHVLMALGLIHDEKMRGRTTEEETEEGPDQNGESQDGNSQGLEARVWATSRAVAPMLLPMIDFLGALNEDDVAGPGLIDDEDG